MNSELVGEPGISAFLRSVLQYLGDISRMTPTDTTFLYYEHLKQDLKNLEEEYLVFFQGLVVDGEAKRLDDLAVDQWMDDLNDLIYNVDDILDDVKSLWKGQVRFDDLKSVSDNMQNRFEKILERSKHLGKKAKKLKLKRGKSESKQPSSTLDTRATSSVVDKSETIHGREKDKDVIGKKLLEVDDKRKKNYDVVGIWGMGGLGKTTLAQQVYNDPEFAKHFEVKRWVCISDVFDVVRALKGLIGDDSTGDAGALQDLHQRLQKIVENKRFLFVLDDVWRSTKWNEKWETMKAPFSSCQKGSKILVTTRDCNIALDLGDEKPYQLMGLPHEQCMSLFKDKAFRNGDVGEVEKEKLMICGEKIVEACKGVPLAIKVIGSMLQRAKEEKWRAVSEKSDLWDMNEIKDGIHPAIRLSYHYLPASLKRCFEYMAVFPPDYQFDQNDVVRLWIADGLVEEVDGRRVKDIGNEYYNELKARSLIQEYNLAYDVMHDIVQHLATVLSRKYCYKENSKEHPASVRHAFLANQNSRHYEFLAQAPYLRTLIDESPDYDENILQNIIRPWKMLRTLKINSQKNYSLEESSSCHLTHLRYLRIDTIDSSHLPDSVSMLHNLKFLVLFGMRLKQLPKDIGNLRSLQELDLHCSGILNLADSICSLCQLQYLNLRLCFELKELPKYIGDLRSLRTLDLESSSISSLPESICSLCELQVLKLNRCKGQKELPKDIGNLSSLQTLDLYFSSISSLPESICSLCQLQVLDLTFCRSLKELPKDIGNLRSLTILKLEETSISSLPESICSLCQLQVLDLKNCKGLEVLPKDIGNLWSLWKLELRESSISSLPESISSLCQLKHLDLSYCGNLKELPKDMGNLKSLKSLDLEHTSILSVPESITSVTGLHNLFNFKSVQLPLHIGRLEGLKRLPIYHVKKEEGRRLGELNLMNRLEGKLTIASMENIGGVEEAEMADLKSKKNITDLEFSWSQPGNDEEMEVKIMEALEPHHALEVLTFSNYGGNKFPVWIMASNICFSNLLILKMKGLNKICELIDMEFVLLDCLVIAECPKLRKVVMATPKLSRLIINNCGELEADSVHLLPSLSDKDGLHSIASQLTHLKCHYNIFEYFFEKLKIANSKWDKLYSISLSAGGRRVTSLPGGWPSMMDCIKFMYIMDMAPGNFQFLPDGDQSPFPPSLYYVDINNGELPRPYPHPHHCYTITSDGKVEECIDR